MEQSELTLENDVDVLAGRLVLSGHLSIPQSPKGAVIFAHGSGSSRHSPRNVAVAQRLNEVGLATLLFDLLTKQEELNRDNVFDIQLLAERLLEATLWLRQQNQLTDLPIGYFGASTGAAAALWAAADPDSHVMAVVSRGGRADMAAPRLVDVHAPTLLIVGGLDDVVIELNQQAQAQLTCENQLVVIPGATHLFEEPGALERVADLAGNWFLKYLAKS
ncbi:MAG TPA: alpha/beta family hydrolase [Candidatus Nanopelagicaceae bacterium]|jgi:putative phosphoribosyl transferase